MPHENAKPKSDETASKPQKKRLRNSQNQPKDTMILIFLNDTVCVHAQVHHPVHPVSHDNTRPHWHGFHHDGALYTGGHHPQARLRWAIPCIDHQWKHHRIEGELHHGRAGHSLNVYNHGSCRAMNCAILASIAAVDVQFPSRSEKSRVHLQHYICPRLSVGGWWPSLVRLVGVLRRRILCGCVCGRPLRTSSLRRGEPSMVFSRARLVSRGQARPRRR